MTQSERAKQCLKWIYNTYDILFNDRFGIIDLVFEFLEKRPSTSSYEISKLDKIKQNAVDELQNLRKNVNDITNEYLEKSGTDIIVPTNGVRFINVIDPITAGYMDKSNKVKKASKYTKYIIEDDSNGRQWYKKTDCGLSIPVLNNGDAIIYKAKDGCNQELNCFAIIDSFDNDNDFDIYAYAIEIPYQILSGKITYYKCPVSLDNFTRATTDEIRDFFKTQSASDMKFYFNTKNGHFPDYLNQYQKFFK